MHIFQSIHTYMIEILNL